MAKSKPSQDLFRLNARLFAVIMAALVIMGVLSSFYAFDYFLHQAKQKHYERQALLLEERIDKKAEILHAATLLLANNSKIRQELPFENRNAMQQEMGHLREQFSKWTGFVNYAFHVITFDGRSLYRSYEPDSFGQDVSNHPMMKEIMSDPSEAVTRLGKGGFNNNYRIINIQPVFSLDVPEELVGFMSVSQGLKRIVKEFAQDGLEYYVFERELDAQGAPTGRYLVDNAPYFADRPFSDQVFDQNELTHNSLQLRDGWYFQTQPIHTAQGEMRAFHIVLTPEQVINDQAWSQTQKMVLVLFIIFLVVFLGGLIQLGLLRRSVLKPMQRLSHSLKTILSEEKYDQTVPVVRDDEIGHVTKLFNQMLGFTDKLIFDLNYQKLAIDKTLIISRADKFGTITEVNDNFCKISGYSKDELIGQPHSIVRHPEMDSAVFKNMWETIQSKQVWQGEVKNRHKDGSSYYVMSYVIPILDRKGELKEYLSIREDITLIVELRETLQKALSQAEMDKHTAEQANKAKSEFLASMSHELRTPLNAIIGYAQVLELAKLEPKSLKQVQTIHTSSKHLLALINDVLDFAKLESGKVQFNFQTLPVADLIEEAVSLTLSQAKEQGISLETEAISEYVNVRVDRLRFKQVMLNLISNAIKYNRPHGDVTIGYQTMQKNEQSFVQIQVRDTGAGISEDDLRNLFQPFNRLGHEGSKIEGTGIGLSITKDLVEQMHGWVEVESVEGEGTTFSVVLPAQKQSVELNEPEQDERAPSNVSSQETLKLIYIGNDPKTMQWMVKETKDLEKVELKIAPGIENGKKQLQNYQSNLIVLDHTLEDVEALAKELSKPGVEIMVVCPDELKNLHEIINKSEDSDKQPESAE
ncbi:MAG: ATP-binding protein [Hydrogenovibrio sp.]|uniref:ATP-binding protein n=1 Tax=Hydrogenovibrio sp. TaxID=2065821 RepID=UPI00287018BF|nr:ATP-binding protein [Hydrogenovibrio sp.]MDR9499517.1 ATP-binding protein [Hydrogenovibrio sp.]